MEQKIPLNPISSNSFYRQRLFTDVEPSSHPWVRHVVSAVAVASLFGVVVLIIMLAVPISMLAIGVRYRHPYYCPIEPRISRFLIVGGSVSLVWIIISILLSLATLFFAYTRSMITIICVVIFSFIILALQIFSIIWLIVGSVWTFRIRSHVQFVINYPFNFPVYCDRTLYQFTFAYLIIIYILIALQICTRCCTTFLRSKQQK